MNEVISCRCCNTDTPSTRGSEQQLSVKQAPDWLRGGLFRSGSAAIFLSRGKWTAVMCKPLAQKPFMMFHTDGRRADKQLLRARAAPAASSGWYQRYQVKDLSTSVCLEQQRWLACLSAAHLIFPLPAFVCQVPRVPVCFTHLGPTQVSASVVTPAQL